MYIPCTYMYIHVCYIFLVYIHVGKLDKHICNDVVYDIVRFLYDLVRTTYNIAKKRTTSYVFYRFLPVIRATSHTTSYVF